MDEILASIRRIIADDEQTSGTATVGDPVATGEKTTAEKAADDDDVLELTEALNEDGTMRHLAPIGGGAVRRPAASGESRRRRRGSSRSCGCGRRCSPSRSAATRRACG